MVRYLCVQNIIIILRKIWDSNPMKIWCPIDAARHTELSHYNDGSLVTKELGLNQVENDLEMASKSLSRLYRKEIKTLRVLVKTTGAKSQVKEIAL